MITTLRAKKILESDFDYQIIFIAIQDLSLINKKKTFSVDEVYYQIKYNGNEISKNNLISKINILTEDGLLKIYMDKYGIALSQDTSIDLYKYIKN